MLVIIHNGEIPKDVDVAAKECGLTTQYVTSEQDLFHKIRELKVGFIVFDLSKDSVKALRTIEKINKDFPKVPLFAIGDRSCQVKVFQAKELGVIDYILRPFDQEEMLYKFRWIMEKKELLEKAQYLHSELFEHYSFKNVIGSSPRMQEVFQLISSVAPTDSTVLLLGETGSGKELIARAIHYNSPRRINKFMAIDCAALPDSLLESELFGYEKGAFTGAAKMKIGKFELAHKGTLFLDEIGNISPVIQMKLLRFLEEQEFERLGGTKTIKVDVRIIAATNENLEKAIAARSFREDFYYRINVFNINIPPLRERKEDIPLLANHFLKKYREKMKKPITGISKDAMKSLMAYNWPGNVRELENVIERAVILEKGETITSVVLPKEIHNLGENHYILEVNENLPLRKLRGEITAEVEKEYLKRVLRRFKGKIIDSACHAGLTCRSLSGKMKKYDMHKEYFK